MDSGKELIASDIASHLGVSEGKLPRLAPLAGYSEADMRVLLEALRNRMIAVIGNDPDNLVHWLLTSNEAFDCRPIDRLGTIEGFREVLRYLQFFIR